jgi:hypothetical protein
MALRTKVTQTPDSGDAIEAPAARPGARNLASDHGDDAVLPLRELFHKLGRHRLCEFVCVAAIACPLYLSATGYELFAEDWLADDPRRYHVEGARKPNHFLTRARVSGCVREKALLAGFAAEAQTPMMMGDKTQPSPTFCATACFDAHKCTSKL